MRVLQQMGGGADRSTSAGGPFAPRERSVCAPARVLAWCERIAETFLTGGSGVSSRP